MRFLTLFKMSNLKMTKLSLSIENTAGILNYLLLYLTERLNCRFSKSLVEFFVYATLRIPIKCLVISSHIFLHLKLLNPFFLIISSIDFIKRFIFFLLYTYLKVKWAYEFQIYLINWTVNTFFRISWLLVIFSLIVFTNLKVLINYF